MLNSPIPTLIQYFSLRAVNRNPYFKNTWPLLLLTILFWGCSSVKQLAVERDVTRLLNQSEVFSSQFTGFSLFDIEANQFVTAHNSTLKFTPASNTKLLTLYATLKSFRDSIPSFAYQKKDSSLLVAPLGDPSFLYKPFRRQPALVLLQSAKNIQISWPANDPEPFGSGWAWDDYIYNFQTQRSWWPIYGNTVSIQKVDDSLTVTPSFFEDYVEVLEQTRPGELVDRELKFNVFKAYLESDTSDFERIIPFEYSRELLLELLQDTLEAEVSFDGSSLIKPDTLYSQHVDTLLAYMLKPSDNFLSEQLLLMAARQNGFEDVESFIDHIRITWLTGLTDMVWVDGSGLSRYNLIAPVDQVRLLKQCHDEFGWERMTALLPTGGEGTLEDLYLTDEDESPYIFAKTGTLSNNHSLSGYLITRSGKRMIFSFMNNHYTRPTEEVKRAMEQFLLSVRNAY
ncbi:MAG: D-alanyl-D-alanine carboxypeptidase [Ekhidna sp.]|uniref:D-alanyl-D-alanine carboxypeptidase n=1 Tax=Ekhidna sp. TaxID=2608089 RepID=UPI0032EDBDDD